MSFEIGIQDELSVPVMLDARMPEVIRAPEMVSVLLSYWLLLAVVEAVCNVQYRAFSASYRQMRRRLLWCCCVSKRRCLRIDGGLGAQRGHKLGGLGVYLGFTSGSEAVVDLGFGVCRRDKACRTCVYCSDVCVDKKSVVGMLSSPGCVYCSDVCVDKKGRRGRCRYAGSDLVNKLCEVSTVWCFFVSESFFEVGFLCGHVGGDKRNVTRYM